MSFMKLECSLPCSQEPATVPYLSQTNPVHKVFTEDPLGVYEGVSKSFRTESITKYMLTIINTRSEATQRVMAAKLTRLTHKIAMQLHLVEKSCTI
jgi:hypothetical protein